MCGSTLFVSPDCDQDISIYPGEGIPWWHPRLLHEAQEEKYKCGNIFQSVSMLHNVANCPCESINNYPTYCPTLSFVTNRQNIPKNQKAQFGSEWETNLQLVSWTIEMWRKMLQKLLKDILGEKSQHRSTHACYGLTCFVQSRIFWDVACMQQERKDNEDSKKTI